MVAYNNKMERRQRMEEFIAIMEIENPGLFKSVMDESKKQLKKTSYMMSFITSIKNKAIQEKRINKWSRSFFAPDIIRSQHGDSIENGTYVLSDEQNKILKEIKIRNAEEEENGRI